MINTLSNSDIDEILKNYKIDYNGIFQKDCLPNKLLNGFYIINLQSSNDGNGTHWCALYKVNDGYSIYFDSFGFLPAKDVEDKLHKYEYNDKQIQNLNSSSCGYFCIAFILFLSKYKSNAKKAFETFLSLFSLDSKKNEIILYKILYP
jgi:transposase-like protein